VHGSFGVKTLCNIKYQTESNVGLALEMAVHVILKTTQ
jgi:hypothetical protein